MAIRLVEYLRSLVRELAKLPDETEWVELKGNTNPALVTGADTPALNDGPAVSAALGY